MLPEFEENSGVTESPIVMLPLNQLMLDPDPLRQELDAEHIKDLAESFALLNRGPLDPLLVRPDAETGKYIILSGNHRFCALQQGGWLEAPCQIVTPATDAQAFLMKLHTNTLRKQLTDLEACEALVREQEIYEAFYPAAKRGGNKVGPYAQFARTETPGFASVKAKSLNRNQAAIRRDIQVGKLVIHMPELKEAKATKQQALAISKRKPEEQALLQKALQESDNKPETLKGFLRSTPRVSPVETQAPKVSAVRHADDAMALFQLALDLLKTNPMDWETLSNPYDMFKLEDLMLQLNDYTKREYYRINTLTIRRKMRPG